jgi:subtilisin family serine protease
MTIFFAKIKYIFLGVAAWLFLFAPFYAKAEEYKPEVLFKYKNNEMIFIKTIPAGENIFEVIANLKKNQNIEYAEPNYIYEAAILPSDTFFQNQWYLKKIKAIRAWDKKRETPEITIAIIDSGIQINHPDLKDNIWRNQGEVQGNGIDEDGNGFTDDVNGWDFVNNISDPNPKFKAGFTESGVIHGTIVAGVAAGYGNNGVGITGVTWQAKLMSLKVLDDKGVGDTRNVVKAIDYAIKNKADIINLSFTGFSYSQALYDAIRRAYDAGIFITAAAGNDEGQGSGVNIDERPIYPACYDGSSGENMVIGVSATDSIDQKAKFSSYGSICVDIASPGVSIFSTTVFAPQYATPVFSLNKKYDGFWSGTSMATPMVSGAAALVMSANPRLGTKGVKDILLQYADDINRLNVGYSGKLGNGRLNIDLSVSNAAKMVSAKREYLAIAPISNKDSAIRLLKFTGEESGKIPAFENLPGDVNLASGDLYGDGSEEIITGSGTGGPPLIRIFKRDGTLLYQFLAYDKNFRGGVNVAAGDVNGDGRDEIITGAGAGGDPQVRVYKRDGVLLSQFLAYDKNFRGGVNVAAGDVTGDGADEIITGPGVGGGPHVRIFKRDGTVVGQFFAFNKSRRYGVKVAAGYFFSGASGNRAAIVTVEGRGGEPTVRIYGADGQFNLAIPAFNKKFNGGVSLAVADFNNDGFDEIASGAGPGGAPQVRVFSRDGQLMSSFYAREESYSGGITVSALNVR